MQLASVLTDARHSCREVVEWSYAVVIRAMFAALERVAATDAKHGVRLRLENYAAFVEGLSVVSVQATTWSQPCVLAFTMVLVVASHSAM